MAKTQLAQQQSPPLRSATLRPRSAKKPVQPPQKLTGAKGAKVERKSTKPASARPVNPFFQLLQKHPLLVWSGVWAAILLAGGLAILGLTNPGHLDKGEQSETETMMSTQNPIPETQDGKWSVSSLLWGAIAVGGAAGSWVLIKQLQGNSGKRRKLRKPLKSRSGSRQPVGQQRQTTASSNRRGVPVFTRNQKPVSPKIAVTNTQKVTTVKQRQADKSNEAKLAESMDLRRRQPLSSLLKKGDF